MKIRKVECRQFAGLKDKKIEFTDGLNVLYGKNEAGKSTMIEAIANTIFKEAKIGGRTREDQEFKIRFFPYPNGDFAEAYLEIEEGKEVFKISKKWSNKKPECYLEKNGIIIQDEKSNKDFLLQIFNRGEATYNILVFQKQKDFKESIKNIQNDKNLRNSIFEFVSRSVLELDGVSIEDLKANIESEIKELTNNWDMDREAPLNNRGINNPYIKNVGLILENYYKKERAKIELEEVIKREDDRDEILKKLKEIEKEYSLVKKELDEIKTFEKDALVRLEIELKKIKLEDEYSQLSHVQNNWPIYNTKLDNMNIELTNIEQKMQKLIKDEEEYTKIKEKEEIEKKLKKVNEIIEQIEKLKEILNSLKEISEQDVRDLEKIKRDIDRLENHINLGEFTIIISTKNGKPVYLTKDLEEKNKVEGPIQVNAKGYAKIETDDFDFEIKLKDFEIEKIREEYVRLKNEFNSLLEQFLVKDIDEATEIALKRRYLVEEITNKDKEIKIILGDDKIEELEKKLREFGNVNITRGIDEIKKEKNELEEKKVAILAEIKNIKLIIDEWEKMYQCPEALLNKIVDVMSDIKMLNKELSNLKPLPERFTSVIAFNKYLNEMKDMEQRLFSERSKLQQQYYSIELDLQNKKSSKDLEEEIRVYEDYYRSYLKKAKNLLKLKNLIYETLDEINNNTFSPIIKSFNEYLGYITNNKYVVKEFSETLGFEIGNDTSKLSLELLSNGTYDTVALALKFALIDNMFDNEIFIVLDDCLVDLDEERRQKAIELIKKFAEKHQVIFTTCNKDTAKLLGGNLIEM